MDGRGTGSRIGNLAAAFRMDAAKKRSRGQNGGSPKKEQKLECDLEGDAGVVCAAAGFGGAEEIAFAVDDYAPGKPSVSTRSARLKLCR